MRAIRPNNAEELKATIKATCTPELLSRASAWWVPCRAAVLQSLMQEEPRPNILLVFTPTFLFVLVCLSYAILEFGVFIGLKPSSSELELTLETYISPRVIKLYQIWVLLMKSLSWWMIFQFIELSFQRKEHCTCCETSVVGLLCYSCRLCGGIMESPDCLGTGLERNVLSSVRKLGLSYRSGLLQQDNGPKHAENDTLERLRAEAFTILECPSLSADLNPFHHLWKELKHAAWRSSLQTCRRGLGCSGSTGAGVSLVQKLLHCTSSSDQHSLTHHFFFFNDSWQPQFNNYVWSSQVTIKSICIHYSGQFQGISLTIVGFLMLKVLLVFFSRTNHRLPNEGFVLSPTWASIQTDKLWIKKP